MVSQLVVSQTCCPFRDRFIGVFGVPFADHVGQERDTGAQDVGQPGGLQRDLVGFGDHPSVGDDGDVGRSAAAALSAASSASSWAEPRCSIERDPRREDHTICTAVAPEAVFTVRMLATAAAYEPRLVRKSRIHRHQSSRSIRRAHAQPRTVSQVRSQTAGYRRGEPAVRTRSAVHQPKTTGHEGPATARIGVRPGCVAEHHVDQLVFS